ncbi:MAG: hypothetical protein H0U32_01560 [Thermoleophilaceae bacterium]|nr:hypothetical protein [Thermoleophilaceae bacterium]
MEVTPPDAVVTYHLDPYASGVVRFNELLADHLGVPFLSLFDPQTATLRRPLLSFKLSEVSGPDIARLKDLLERTSWRHQLFLHDWSDLPLERLLAEAADGVWCGSREIYDRVHLLNPRTDVVWTPGLISDRRTYEETEIAVFSFGMAHKIQTDMFGRLRDLLDASGRSYAVYVSSANHETSSMRDAQAVFDEMHAIFPRRLYFLGNLSDVAVYNQLATATFFAAFFAKGVRANNTSVAAAMEQGAVVITNLDEHSPDHLRHMENVIDIARCRGLPTEADALDDLSGAAKAATRGLSWDSLAARMGVVG